MTEVMKHPSTFIFVCGMSASVSGIAYLMISGAPLVYSIVNGGALVVGLLLYVVRQVPVGRKTFVHPEFWMFFSAAVLILTALFGAEIEGIKRWIAIGPVLMQPGIILVPLMTLLFAGRPERLPSIAICIAALALALQPDRATAGVLAAATIGILLHRRDLTTFICAAVSVFSFCIALFRPDNLPAIEFVEGVYRAAVASGILSSLLVALGTAILLVPAFYIRVLPTHRSLLPFVFGVVWFTFVLAALFGNYPTPLVGYGSSSIIGYFLCLYAFSIDYSKRKRD